MPKEEILDFELTPEPSNARHVEVWPFLFKIVDDFVGHCVC